ncbi:MAG: thioesterase family protein [Beijerinckiaceae bacterium]
MTAETPSVAAPLLTASVDPAWIDYNGHMNDAYYALVFSRSVDKLMEAIGLDTHGRERSSRTIYTLTLTVHYHHEVTLGDRLAVTGRFLEHDKKRIRVWLEMTRAEGTLAATSEQILLCVDQSGEKPRAASFPPLQLAAIASMSAATAHVPWPQAAGRGISLKRG